MAETYTGQVQNGSIILDEGTPLLPEGMRVRIEPTPGSTGSTPLPELTDRLDAIPADPPADRVAGTRAMLLAWARKAEEFAPDLPADLAENHDHYAHGRPLE